MARQDQQGASIERTSRDRRSTEGVVVRSPGRIDWFLVALCVPFLAGCGLNRWAHNGFKVGPDYCKPAVPVASAWIDYQDPGVSSDPAELATWWMVFEDPVLNELIQTAADQNINLRVAGMRIMESRYRRQIAAGNLFPQYQEAAGSYSRNKLSANVANAPPNLWFSNWEAGVNASWELDFWGRFRRAVEASDAELDGSIETYDDVLVLLLAEVASSYVDLRTYQERRSCALNNVAAQESSLRIAEQKFQFGAATRRDVEQARSVLEQTAAGPGIGGGAGPGQQPVVRAAGHAAPGSGGDGAG